MTAIREGKDIYKGCTEKAYKAYQCFRITLYIVLVALIAFVIKDCASPSNNTDVEVAVSRTDGTAATSTLYIPTVKELQQALCEAGYPVEVDCVVGKETKRQWDRYCADRMAAKFMTPSGRPK